MIISNKMSDAQQQIAELVERSRNAQKIAESFTQRKVDEITAEIVYKMSRTETAMEIAEMAYAETGMGRVDSKASKLTVKMPSIFHEIREVKTVDIIERIPEKGIVKIAKPLGVIAALVPSTNPEGTPAFNGVLGLRARNSVIFAPHPKSKRTTLKVVNIMREILKKNEVPEDLFICIENPSKELSMELMRQCDITMATGSADMVKAAYSSGKPAYGVGAGNAVIVIDETADINETATKIRIGKTGDNASGCSAENSLVIHESIYDEMIEALKAQGGYLANTDEKAKLQKAMWIDGHLSGDIIAKPANVIAQCAGINIPANTAFIMVEETGVGKEYPFSGEKLSLVIAIYKYKEFDDAINKINAIQRYSGFGHSCGIHSNKQENIEKLALATYTTKVIVRQPHGAANSGNWFNGLARTFSLGCGTWGGNIVSENITQKHYFNTTWVSYPIAPINVSPATDTEIYGDLLENKVL